MEKGRMNTNNKRLHKYSCENGALTLEWVDALAKFLKQYEFLWSAHVVNFFQGRLWEALDKEWMECLREETVENLLLLPSGIVQGNWPDSLKEFVHTAQSLALPREAGTTLEMNFPGLSMPSFGSVLAQGMNSKKRHEVEILAAVIQRVANEVEANDIIDVGAGQGYLAQVLSFEYRLSVIALDASAHHSTVTRKRAERIKKHYQGRMQKSYLGHYPLSLPQTVTCCVPSGNSLTGLSKVLSSSFSLSAENCRQTTLPSDATAQSEYASSLKCFETESNGQTLLQNSKRVGPSLVLAGLHACGDLSVTMLRTFLECEEVKALISVGCCYNLLSEGHNDENLHHCAFPMSNGVKILGLPLGKNGRDLACQSAERWKSLMPEAAMENFEVHAFRAAFQMVLHKFYPMVAETSPSVGRLGKARRCQKNKGASRCRQFGEESLPSSSVVGCKEASLKIGHTETSTSEQLKTFATNFDALRFADVVDKESTSWSLSSQAPENPIGKDEDSKLGDGNDIGNGLDAYLGNDFQSGNIVKSSFSCARGFGSTKIDTSMIFNEYSMSALGRLGLPFIPNEEIFQIWKEVQPNAGLIGPYWSLRAVLGPLLETFLLLDRLLFLQEKSNVAEAIIIPLFNPCISPRNMAIVARKVGTNNLAQ